MWLGKGDLNGGMVNNALLTVHNLVAGYGKALVLNHISLTVDFPEIVALLGANGAGKTTTLRAIIGLIPCWEGEIVFGEIRINQLPPSDRVRLGLAYCPEGRGIFANLSVLENLRVGAYTLRNRREFLENLHDVFALFPRLKERLHQLAGYLSGGEQQMLAIGRALMSKPKMLLLDEPSLGLAPILVKEIYSKIVELHGEQKISILLVEQNVDIALTVSHRAYVLEKGQIVLYGLSSDLRSHPVIQTAYLGG